MTQVLLGNIASTIAFIFILGNFFVNRIRGTFLLHLVRDQTDPVTDEERFLVKFFGNDYTEYRKRVGTGLPFPVPA
jgi:protein-S-isoprenylcysteine O-methyltransferase